MDLLTVTCPIPRFLLSLKVSHINMNIHIMWFILDCMCYSSSQSLSTHSQTVNICDLEKSLQPIETWFPCWNKRKVVEMASVIHSFLKRGVVSSISANEFIGFVPSLRSNNMVFLSRILFLLHFFLWFHDLRNYHLWVLLPSYPEASVSQELGTSLLQFLWCPVVQILLWCIVTEFQFNPHPSFQYLLSKAHWQGQKREGCQKERGRECGERVAL